MKDFEESTTWRSFWLIIALAAATAAVIWIAWGGFGGAAATALSVAGTAAYLVAVYRIIRGSGFPRNLVVQFVMLSVVAFVVTCLVGAVIALAVRGEPVGPPN